MLKILKNCGIGFCLKTNRPLYEYIIFDCSKQEQQVKKMTTLQAMELRDYFDMVVVSPLQAINEGLFEYNEVQSIDYPLPF
jgi:hypothetical protein